MDGAPDIWAGWQRREVASSWRSDVLARPERSFDLDFYKHRNARNSRNNYHNGAYNTSPGVIVRNEIPILQARPLQQAE